MPSPPFLTSIWRVIQFTRTLLSLNAKKWLPLSSPKPSQPPKITFERQQSLLDCMPDDNTIDEKGKDGPSSPFDSFDNASRTSSFATATSSTSQATSPATIMYSRMSSLSSPEDVDKKAEDFIADFRRRISLELHYVSATNTSVSTPISGASPVTPISPETYFNLRKWQAIFGNVSRPPPTRRASSLEPGIKYPSSSSSTKGRPTLVI